MNYKCNHVTQIMTAMNIIIQKWVLRELLVLCYHSELYKCLCLSVHAQARYMVHRLRSGLRLATEVVHVMLLH